MKQLSSELPNDASISICDVSDADQVRHVFEQNSQKNPSILINCAGITRDGWISNLSMDDWDSVIDVNLKGTFLTCREFLRFQNERLKRGEASPACSIVNVGSVVSEFGNLGQSNYAASKGGVLGLTRALAKEGARSNVRVNAVLPGFIEIQWRSKYRFMSKIRSWARYLWVDLVNRKKLRISLLSWHHREVVI